MEITPLGDSALLIRVAENFDDAPEDALSKVLAAKRGLEAAQIPGAIEIAPAYTTVGLFYDLVRAIDAGAPVENVFGWIEQRIRRALSEVEEIHANRTEGSLVEIPVCYETEFALDLEHVARHAGVDWKEVVDLHCAADYRVHCVGFTPGFPFLGGLSRKLATPRRDVPRKEIPAGSVAIGGSQTGIYPIKSPGGWNVIGRTPLQLFDPQKNPPALLRAGDRVRFRSITRDEFETKTR
ncbi:MAG TPA: 5-oxoprolinase subunit PxpB [Chthoniobacterales bacterium]|jgi:inhibitor of KinA|nr:5-oxoprolinase subunit PxpB [Chthoniobacterales bacterium]